MRVRSFEVRSRSCGGFVWGAALMSAAGVGDGG